VVAADAPTIRVTPTRRRWPECPSTADRHLDASRPFTTVATRPTARGGIEGVLRKCSNFGAARQRVIAEKPVYYSIYQ
jgi:hypothetical protein